MAITSSTDICNLSADLLACDRVSDIEDPQTGLEELFNRWYDHARLRVLRQHSWNFAIKRQELAASSVPLAFGSGKRYPVPADCVRFLYLMDSNGNPIDPQLYQFEGKEIILSDSVGDSCRFVYISDIQDVLQFDALFIDLLAVEIALSCAYKITISSSNVERLQDMQRRLSALARSIDGQERPPQSVVRSKAILGRRMFNTRISHIHGF